MGRKVAHWAAVLYGQTPQHLWGTAESHGELLLLGCVGPHGEKAPPERLPMERVGPESSFNKSDQSPAPRKMPSFAPGTSSWPFKLSFSSILYI